MGHDSAQRVLRRSATPRGESSTWADQILGNAGATAPISASENVLGKLEGDSTLLGNEWHYIYQNEKVFLRQYA